MSEQLIHELESAKALIEQLESQIERLYEEKEKLIYQLENYKIRAEFANGKTYEEMRKNLSHELWRQGDVKLMWVNEGDYYNSMINFSSLLER